MKYLHTNACKSKLKVDRWLFVYFNSSRAEQKVLRVKRIPGANTECIRFRRALRKLKEKPSDTKRYRTMRMFRDDNGKHVLVHVKLNGGSIPAMKKETHEDDISIVKSLSNHLIFAQSGVVIATSVAAASTIKKIFSVNSELRERKKQLLLTQEKKKQIEMRIQEELAEKLRLKRKAEKDVELAERKLQIKTEEEDAKLKRRELEKSLAIQNRKNRSKLHEQNIKELEKKKFKEKNDARIKKSKEIREAKYKKEDEEMKKIFDVLEKKEDEEKRAVVAAKNAKIAQQKEDANNETKSEKEIRLYLEQTRRNVGHFWKMSVADRWGFESEKQNSGVIDPRVMNVGNERYDTLINRQPRITSEMSDYLNEREKNIKPFHPNGIECESEEDPVTLEPWEVIKADKNYNLVEFVTKTKNNFVQRCVAIPISPDETERNFIYAHIEGITHMKEGTLPIVFRLGVYNVDEVGMAVLNSSNATSFRITYLEDDKYYDAHHVITLDPIYTESGFRLMV